MRLVDIVEALDPIAKFNRELTKLLATPPRDYFTGEPTDPVEAERERRRINEGWRLVRKAVRFHAENFNGKRWPELEQVLLVDAGFGWADNPTLVGYLNQISEDWPEGENALIQGISSLHGSNEGTIDYFLKKNLKSPPLHAYYQGMLSAKSLRRHLTDRKSRFQKDLADSKEELIKLQAQAQPVDPTGLDDRDEFQSHRIRLTIKQLENRIKTIEQTLTLPDDQLVDLVMVNRPKTHATREALGLPWAPSNLATYVARWGLR